MEETIYCPILQGEITEYDCYETVYATNTGHHLNDGIPYLLDIETITANREVCLACSNNPCNNRRLSEQERMSDEEIKKRLAGRAAEYMMFKDDEEDTEAPADTSSAGNVIVFPDFEKLKNEVEKMRTELSMLLLERDELQFVICKNIDIYKEV